MQTAEPGKLGVFQPGDGAEQANLLGVLELGLETHHVPQRAELVVLAKLNYRVSPAPVRELGRSFVRVVEPDRFHRAKTERFHPARRHHLDRHTAFEIRRAGLPLAKLGLLARQQPRVESNVLLFRHRAIDVVLATLVPASGHPRDVHVDGVPVDDRGDGIEERQRFRAGRRADAVGESCGGEWPGGDDRQPIARQYIDPLAHDL